MVDKGLINFVISFLILYFYRDLQGKLDTNMVNINDLQHKFDDMKLELKKIGKVNYFFSLVLFKFLLIFKF